MISNYYHNYEKFTFEVFPDDSDVRRAYVMLRSFVRWHAVISDSARAGRRETGFMRCHAIRGDFGRARAMPRRSQASLCEALCFAR